MPLICKYRGAPADPSEAGGSSVVSSVPVIVVANKIDLVHSSDDGGDSESDGGVKTEKIKQLFADLCNKYAEIEGASSTVH